jgi:hypothetical protein
MINRMKNIAKDEAPSRLKPVFEFPWGHQTKRPADQQVFSFVEQITFTNHPISGGSFLATSGFKMRRAFPESFDFRN